MISRIEAPELANKARLDEVALRRAPALQMYANGRVAAFIATFLHVSRAAVRRYTREAGQQVNQ